MIGRILIAAAEKFKARAVGIEISAKLVKAATESVRKLGLQSRVQVIHDDILNVDLSQADVWLRPFREQSFLQLPVVPRSRQGPARARDLGGLQILVHGNSPSSNVIVNRLIHVIVLHSQGRVWKRHSRGIIARRPARFSAISSPS